MDLPRPTQTLRKRLVKREKSLRSTTSHRLADAGYVKVGSGRKPYDRDPEDEDAPR